MPLAPRLAARCSAPQVPTPDPGARAPRVRPLQEHSALSVFAHVCLPGNSTGNNSCWFPTNFGKRANSQHRNGEEERWVAVQSPVFRWFCYRAEQHIPTLLSLTQLSPVQKEQLLSGRASELISVRSILICSEIPKSHTRSLTDVYRTKAKL